MIEKLKALEAAATPGPWQADLDDSIVWGGNILVADVYAEVPDVQVGANTHLLPALRNLARELIALWECAREADLNFETNAELCMALGRLEAKAAEVLK